MYPYIDQSGPVVTRNPAVRPYNPNAYVPGGGGGTTDAMKAKAIQDAGYARPGQTPIWVPQAQTPRPPTAGSPASGGTGSGAGGTGAGGTNKPAPPPRPDLSKLDYSFDPLLQAGNQGGEMQLTGARARMLEQQKQLLLRFGSREMARKLLGEDPFTDTVSDDPYAATSDLAQSRYQEIAARNQADITNNKQNLFFSSNRAGDLAQVARERALRDQALQMQLQSDMGGLSDQYTTIEQAVRAQKLAAEKDAYDRAVQQALLNWQNSIDQSGSSDAGLDAGGNVNMAAPPAPFAPTGGMSPGGQLGTIDYGPGPPVNAVLGSTQSPAGTPYTDNTGQPFVPTPIQVGGMMDPTAALNAARLRRLMELNG